MDAPIKRMLAASSSNEDERNIIGTQKLCGVNSYNIGRPMVQMVHFVSMLDSANNSIDYMYYLFSHHVSLKSDLDLSSCC